ncbi:hypothetical protein KY346_05205 [Candidatus Woesearchaeota archaeon]|nr:hypothetical protein [Candidatus Woesearchaeota archaeon]
MVDEDYLENIDVPLEERIASIENHVLELELKNRIKFPPTAKIQGRFLIINDLVYTQDQYDGIVVYDLRTGNPVSSIKLNSYQLKGMATDGKSLFLHMEGIDFRLQNDDIVIAKCKDPVDEFSMTDFVGKRAEEAEGVYSYLDASKSGINGMIFSIPLEVISSQSIMFGPTEYSKEAPRFLIHKDMSMTRIASGPGFINVFYNFHFGEGGCGTGCRIVNNEVQSRHGNLDMFKEKTPDRKLPLILRMRESCGKISASYELPVYNEEYHEEDSQSIYLPIVFKPRENESLQASELQRNDDLVHILYNHRTSKPNPGWIIRVHEPFSLETYRARIMELKPADK